MRTSTDEGVSAHDKCYETHSLTVHEQWDINSATSSLSTPVLSKEEARKIKPANDPLTKQSDRLWDLMKELRYVA